MVRILFIAASLGCLLVRFGNAQSFELMIGTEEVFVDAQYLKFFDSQKRLSLFSRARATSTYEESSTDLFTGAYLNYTTSTGLGATVLGRIASSGSGVDAGVHFFKASSRWLIYALPSININDKLLYSWFSIIRFTPRLSERWKWYFSLELYSAFNKDGHLGSVQRARAGVDLLGYQFGAAINLAQRGVEWESATTNPGIFVRKEF